MKQRNVGTFATEFGPSGHCGPEPKHILDSADMASFPVTTLPHDDRGWIVLEVAAQSPTSSCQQIYKVTICGKTLELLAQEVITRVYVNPDQEGPDEVDIGGIRMRLWSLENRRGR